MDRQELESAFLAFRDRLEKLAARSLNPVLSGRFSPEDVVQETMASVSRDSSAFLANQDLPVYFRLRTALLGIGEKAASLRYVRALQRLRRELDAYSEFRP